MPCFFLNDNTAPFCMNEDRILNLKVDDLEVNCVIETAES